MSPHPLPPRHHRGPVAIFRLPAALALSTFAGLIIALTGDGWRDATAWAALALPIGAFLWAFARRH